MPKKRFFKGLWERSNLYFAMGTLCVGLSGMSIYNNQHSEPLTIKVEELNPLIDYVNKNSSISSRTKYLQLDHKLEQLSKKYPQDHYFSILEQNLDTKEREVTFNGSEICTEEGYDILLNYSKDQIEQMEAIKSADDLLSVTNDSLGVIMGISALTCFGIFGYLKRKEIVSKR